MRAEEADLHRLLRFRAESASWLRELGLDQWARPFPTDKLLASIQAGEVYLIKDSDGADAVATVTLDRKADPRLWTPEEQQETALYVHKLTVDRSHAGVGLGARILDWAGDQAARQGCEWLRLDAWTENPRLQQYYLDLGFKHVRTSTAPTVVSGWMAQRPAARNDGHGLGEGGQ